MRELTREQIEEWRKWGRSGRQTIYLPNVPFDILCDMALASLSRPSEAVATVTSAVFGIGKPDVRIKWHGPNIEEGCTLYLHPAERPVNEERIPKRLAPLCEEHGSGSGARSSCLYCVIIKLTAALSKIDYLCGPQNEMQCSGYDVHYDENAVVEHVRQALSSSGTFAQGVEAAAKVCDDKADSYDTDINYGERLGARACAVAVRALSPQAAQADTPNRAKISSLRGMAAGALGDKSSEQIVNESRDEWAAQAQAVEWPEEPDDSMLTAAMGVSDKNSPTTVRRQYQAMRAAHLKGKA